MPNMTQYKDARALMAHKVSSGKRETTTERNKRRETVCKHCYYRTSDGHLGTCDYIGVEGHQRPCSRTECVEAGVFKEAPHARKRNALSLRR